MQRDRKRSGFRQAATVPAQRLEMPLARARQLRLEQAWHAVAGADIARHVRPLRIREATLELETDDERWAAAVRPLVPGLAARMAARFPDLGIRRFRLRRAGARPDAPPEPVEAGACAPVEPPVPRATTQRDSAPETAGSPGERLEAALRSLERRRQERQKP